MDHGLSRVPVYTNLIHSILRDEFGIDSYVGGGANLTDDGLIGSTMSIGFEVDDGLPNSATDGARCIADSIRGILAMENKSVVVHDPGTYAFDGVTQRHFYSFNFRTCVSPPMLCAA